MADIVFLSICYVNTGVGNIVEISKSKLNSTEKKSHLLLSGLPPKYMDVDCLTTLTHPVVGEGESIQI